MKTNYNYATVSEAITELRKKGYALDFNLEENCIACQGGKFNAADFEIAEIYRYEGNSDPADEAAVYAIEASGGTKGILVTGYGMYTDRVSEEILAKLTTF
jgi:hypothetical protein